MGWGKRRRGKQSSGRSTPVVASSNKEDVVESSEADAPHDGEDYKPTTADSTTETHAAAEATAVTPTLASEEDALVLTSEKRRGVYECDYCHSDISQLPRIRCAVCSDFDLCLDCFATTDHAAAIARWKAAATAHSELAADGIASTLVAGLSCTNHDDTHGYRVCDSTRYPLLASNRTVVPWSTTSSTGPALPDATRPPESQDVSSSKAPDSSVEEGGGEQEYRWVVSDDPKVIWTVEEDLRLIDAIKTHGLGNWTDISDAISGNGSVGKTPRRCMERYFDDFLGRYGHILPQYTIVEENINDDETSSNYNADVNTNNNDAEGGGEDWEEESVRSSKRKPLSRLPSNVSASSNTGRARKRFKVVPTETLPGYAQLWPDPYLPPVDGVQMGQEVARDLSTKNELAFVKATAAATTMEEVDKIRQEWEEKRQKLKVGAPTVLPPRAEDIGTLPGAELVGFMPRRGDFDIEHENEAENAIADMEFLETDTEQERQLKVQVLQIYYQKQNEREKRKQFILSRNLFDYRKYVKNEQDLPQDERDLRHRMRLFERFHTPQEHKLFIDDIIKAKRLRKEIAKLQMYRRIGIRSLAEAEKYELDKARRQFHKVAQLQKETESKTTAALSGGASSTNLAASGAAVSTANTNTPNALSLTTPAGSGPLSSMQDTTDDSPLWKSYRTTDRKGRRSINRTNSEVSAETSTTTPNEQTKADPSSNLPETSEEAMISSEQDDTMQVEEATPTKTNVQPLDNDGGKQDNEMQVDIKENHNDFDISTSRGYDLLSRREADLCVDLKIYPVQYLEIKKALIQESLTKGLLEKEGPGSGRRIVVKMDIQRRGDVIDFLLRAGWISSRLAQVARTVTPPPSTAGDD